MTHNGKTKTYSFMFGDVKIMLVPNKECGQSKQSREENKGCVNLLTLTQFEGVVKEAEIMYVLLGKMVDIEETIPEAVLPLLEEFADFF